MKRCFSWRSTLTSTTPVPSRWRARKITASSGMVLMVTATAVDGASGGAATAGSGAGAFVSTASLATGAGGGLGAGRGGSGARSGARSGGRAAGAAAARPPGRANSRTATVATTSAAAIATTAANVRRRLLGGWKLGTSTSPGVSRSTATGASVAPARVALVSMSLTSSAESCSSCGFSVCRGSTRGGTALHERGRGTDTTGDGVSVPAVLAATAGPGGRDFVGLGGGLRREGRDDGGPGARLAGAGRLEVVGRGTGTLDFTAAMGVGVLATAVAGAFVEEGMSSQPASMSSAKLSAFREPPSALEATSLGTRCRGSRIRSRRTFVNGDSRGKF